MLDRLLQRAGVLRTSVRRENLSEFRHQLGVPSAPGTSPTKRSASSLIKLQSSSFFLSENRADHAEYHQTATRQQLERERES